MAIDRLQSVIEKRGRVIAGCFLVVGLLGVRSWVVTPHLASLKAAQQYERATGDRIEKSRAITGQLRAERTRLEKLAAEYTLLSDMAFSPAKADKFLRNLETVCEQSGCGVASLSFMDGQDQTTGGAGPSVVARRVALTIQGGYGSIARLIGKLQTRREKVWIDELHMAGFASDSGRGTCQMTITIYVNRDSQERVETGGVALASHRSPADVGLRYRALQENLLIAGKNADSKESDGALESSEQR